MNCVSINVKNINEFSLKFLQEQEKTGVKSHFGVFTPETTATQFVVKDNTIPRQIRDGSYHGLPPSEFL